MQMKMVKMMSMLIMWLGVKNISKKSKTLG